MPSYKLLDHVLVRCVADPALWHQRVLLHHVSDQIWVVMTPDRDTFTLDLQGSTLCGIAPYPRPQLPAGWRPAECHLEANAGSGAFSDKELTRATEDTLELKQQRLRSLGLPDGTEPGSYRVSVNTEGIGPRRGETIEATPHCKRIGNLMLSERSGRAVTSEWVEDAKFEEWLATTACSDLRTMPVQYDLGSGERYRSLEDAAPLLTPAKFNDWPVDGPRSVSWFIKALRKSHLTFITHHQTWVHRSGVREGDRVVHEHMALRRSMNLLACYDQVNVANFAGCGAMMKRLQLLEEAYWGRPSAPNFDGAEHFPGVTESADGSLVDPELRKHASSKLKEETDVKKEQQKYMEELRERQKAPGKGAGKEAVPKT